MEYQSYTPKKAMAIFAHPDDIEFTCAGTTARWVKEGAEVVYVLCTSGDAGITEKGMTREQAKIIREKETLEAARIAGVNTVEFLGEPDGRLMPTLELRKKLVKSIRKHKPEVVICGDPTVVLASSSYINHPDHRAAATAAIDAVFPAAGQPNLYEEFEQEGITAHKPRKVFVQSWEKADYFVNISETIETKIEALKAHKSQMKDWDPAPMLKEWGADYAKGKEMAYAEGYKQITLVSDEDWEKCKGDPFKL